MGFLDPKPITPGGLDAAAAGKIASPTSQTSAALDVRYGPVAAPMRAAFRPARSAFTGAIPNAWSTSQVVMPKADMLIAMASASKTTIYGPCIIAVPDGTPGKLGNYYLYWSTDHDNNTGGIFMAYANDPMGPWTPKTFTVDSVHKFGTAYCDNGYVTGGGNQTETPWVIWDGTQFVMYYQQRGGIGTGAQSTLSATSANGLDWTRRGLALNFPSLNLPGDGHTGYATVYDIGDRFIAYSLCGGGEYSRQAIWYSMDGQTFTMDKRVFVYQVEMTGHAEDLRVSMAVRLFEWRGEIWGQFAIKTPSAGTGIPTQYQSVIARIRDDFRGFKGGIYPAIFGASSYIEHGGDLYGISLDANQGIVAAKLEA